MEARDLLPQCVHVTHFKMFIWSSRTRQSHLSSRFCNCAPVHSALSDTHMLGPDYTWHTHVTSPPCNQIHMASSLFSQSVSISHWNSFTLFIHPWLCLHILLTACFSFDTFFALVLVHHLCLSLVSDLSLRLSMGFAVKLEVILIAKLQPACGRLLAFYGQNLLLRPFCGSRPFVHVVIKCSTVQKVVRCWLDSSVFSLFDLHSLLSCCFMKCLNLKLY